jgi:hypothetical protein
MLGRIEQVMRGTARGLPSRSRTAKASHIRCYGAVVEIDPFTSED